MTQAATIALVIRNENCVGCGACAIAAPGDFAIEMTPAGQLAAKQLGSSDGADIVHLCPMSGASKDETEIATGLFPDLPVVSEIGRYRAIHAATVGESDFRDNGGSGGMGTWIATELLRQGEVDAVVHVRPCDPDTNDGLLFRYQVSHTVEAIRAGSKSRYYPITLVDPILQMISEDKRYCVVGLPCFIKAVRLLEVHGRIPPGRIAHTIGLVCGHLKSRYFAEYLAWQKGAAPGEVIAFDFRHKLAGRRSSDYGFSFVTRGELAPVIAPMAGMYARDWGEGQFKYAACEFCDDVFAECADVVIGDAWLPQYVADHRGTNIVLSRSEKMLALVGNGASGDRIVIEDLSVSEAIDSQSSGLRHRREGLAHRLAVRLQKGQWAPRKRVAPRKADTMLRRAVYALRLKLARKSSATYANVIAAGLSPTIYRRRILKYLVPYKVASRTPSLMKRLRRLWAK